MELKFPSAGTPAYTRFDYQLEKETGTYPGSEGSFSRTFMEVLDNELGKCTGDYHSYVSTNVKDMLNDSMQVIDLITGHDRGKKGPQYNDMKQRCNQINMQFGSCRKKINSAMVKFLLENDGVIDRWPYVEDTVKITIGSKVGEDPYKNEFTFAYFGDEFKPAGHKVYREKEVPVYNHDFYNPYETEELKEAQQYEHEKHRLYFDSKANTGNKGRMKRFVALLPLIFAVLFLAFSLFCYFKDVIPVHQVNAWAKEFSNIPGILLFIPKVILYVFAYVSEILRLNNILFWVGTGAISLIGIVSGIKKVTSPKLKKVSKQKLEEMWEENIDAFEKRLAIEKEIKAASDGWNSEYCNFVRTQYKKSGI